VPSLSEELRALDGNMRFHEVGAATARIDVLLLDDWGMAPLDATVRNDLLEMIDDLATAMATIVTQSAID
jgi:DNA replication protein DnaC